MCYNIAIGNDHIHVEANLQTLTYTPDIQSTRNIVCKTYPQ